jgi:hypothetical protein
MCLCFLEAPKSTVHLVYVSTDISASLTDLKQRYRSCMDCTAVLDSAKRMWCTDHDAYICIRKISWTPAGKPTWTRKLRNETSCLSASSELQKDRHERNLPLQHLLKFTQEDCMFASLADFKAPHESNMSCTAVLNLENHIVVYTCWIPGKWIKPLWMHLNGPDIPAMSLR